MSVDSIDVITSRVVRHRVGSGPHFASSLFDIDIDIFIEPHITAFASTSLPIPLPYFYHMLPFASGGAGTRADMRRNTPYRTILYTCIHYDQRSLSCPVTFQSLDPRLRFAILTAGWCKFIQSIWRLASHVISHW